MQALIYTALVSAALAGLLGGWGGYHIGTAKCADDAVAHAEHLRDQAISYAQAWKQAVEDARRDAAVEARREAERAELRRAASEATRRVIHEMLADPDPRDCDWRPEHRLRIESIYRARGYAPDGTRDPARMRGEMQQSTEYAPVGGGMGSGGIGLGARVREAPR